MAFPSKGDRVAHFQYGPGTITDMDVHHTVIDFDGFGSRRFVTSRVVLERTSDPGPTAAERKAVDAERTKAARAAKKAAAPPKESKKKARPRSRPTRSRVLRYYGGGHWKLRPPFSRASRDRVPRILLRVDNAERVAQASFRQ